MRTVSLVDMLSRMSPSSRRAGAVVVAVEPDRGLPDALDQVEHVGAFLVAHGVAEDAPEQPDVVAQRRILIGLSRRHADRFPRIRHDRLRR